MAFRMIASLKWSTTAEMANTPPNRSHRLGSFMARNLPSATRGGPPTRRNPTHRLRQGVAFPGTSDAPEGRASCPRTMPQTLGRTWRASSGAFPRPRTLSRLRRPCGLGRPCSDRPPRGALVAQPALDLREGLLLDGVLSRVLVVFEARRLPDLWVAPLHGSADAPVVSDRARHVVSDPHISARRGRRSARRRYRGTDRGVAAAQARCQRGTGRVGPYRPRRDVAFDGEGHRQPRPALRRDRISPRRGRGKYVRRDEPGRDRDDLRARRDALDRLFART